MAKLYIGGTICTNDESAFYRWFGMDASCPKDVRQAVAEANGAQLCVYINSPGGDVSAAAEMYTLLREYGNTKIIVTGLAGSAASVIACAGYCEIAPVGLFFLHRANTRASGNKNDLQKAVQMLDAVDETIATAYCSKTKKSKNEMLELMEADSWIPASQAVEIGLADAVFLDQPVTAATFATMLSEDAKQYARRMMEKEKKEPEVSAYLRLLELEKK